MKIIVIKHWSLSTKWNSRHLGGVNSTLKSVTRIGDTTIDLRTPIESWSHTYSHAVRSMQENDINDLPRCGKRILQLPVKH